MVQTAAVEDFAKVNPAEEGVAFRRPTSQETALKVSREMGHTFSAEQHRRNAKTLSIDSLVQMIADIDAGDCLVEDGLRQTVRNLYCVELDSRIALRC
ncbi:MAG: hypothetical protein V3T31_06245 [candidate division Zixibacteria bacterium]